MLTDVTDSSPPPAGTQATRVRGPEAFDAFYAEAAPRLVRQLSAMTGGAADAQDCVQEAFARAWQRWDALRRYDAPDAWVRTVAWRLAVSRVRRVRTAARHLVGQRGAEVAEPSPDHVVLVAALRRLPAEQRRALVLHHLADLSVQEVADETGVPVGTVKARLSRGRAALALALADIPVEDCRA